MKENNLAGMLAAVLIVGGALAFYQIYRPGTRPSTTQQELEEISSYYGGSPTFDELAAAANAGVINPTFEQILAAKPSEEIIKSAPKLAEAILEAATYPVSTQAKETVLAKTQAYAEAISPTVAVLQFTGQKGVGTALALTAPLLAGHEAALAARYQSQLVTWQQQLAIATAQHNWTQVAQLSSQKPVAPK